MRQKDFDEVMRVLGNEVRVADSGELEGLVAARQALIGHARHVYPDVSVTQMLSAYAGARRDGL